jgi:hypothetical protein
MENSLDGFERICGNCENYYDEYCEYCYSRDNDDYLQDNNSEDDDLNDYYYDVEYYDDDCDSDYCETENKNSASLADSGKYEKTYKNPILTDLKNGVSFDIEQLKSIVKKYSKEHNDYAFIKKVFSSDGTNKSVKNNMLYSEFIDNISELFDDEEEKKKILLKLAKKSKKIIRHDFKFDFDVFYPSDELVKFVHTKNVNKQEVEIDLMFKYFDLKKLYFEGYLIFKIAMKQLRNLNKNENKFETEKKKYLSDNHIITILETLCKEKNLKYTKESLLKALTNIKNYNEESFEEDEDVVVVEDKVSDDDDTNIREI